MHMCARRYICISTLLVTLTNAHTHTYSQTLILSAYAHPHSHTPTCRSYANVMHEASGPELNDVINWLVKHLDLENA